MNFGSHGHLNLLSLDGSSPALYPVVNLYEVVKFKKLLERGILNTFCFCCKMSVFVELIIFLLHTSVSFRSSISLEQSSVKKKTECA